MAWYCFSRPDDDGHEYVACDLPHGDYTLLPADQRNGHLYTEDGVILVFDRDQVVAIHTGADPRDAARLRRRPPGELDAPKDVPHSGRRFIAMPPTVAQPPTVPLIVNVPNAEAKPKRARKPK